MKNVTTISVSIPKELAVLLKETAEADGRSVSNFVTQLLLKALKKQGESVLTIPKIMIIGNGRIWNN